MPKPLAEYLVRSGKPRRCHRCDATLPLKISARYRGTRPYCAACVDLCKTPTCGKTRGDIYVGLCDVCGRDRVRVRANQKTCSKCDAPMKRGESRARLCSACRVSPQESEYRRRENRKIERRSRNCLDCGMSVGAYRRYCEGCRTRRTTESNRRGSKISKKKRRAQLYGVRHALTSKQWAETLTLFAHLCAYCGRAAKDLEQEHVVPMSRRGDHSVDNVVPACRSCNARKSDHNLLMFLARDMRSIGDADDACL